MTIRAYTVRRRDERRADRLRRGYLREASLSHTGERKCCSVDRIGQQRAAIEANLFDAVAILSKPCTSLYVALMTSVSIILPLNRGDLNHSPNLSTHFSRVKPPGLGLSIRNSISKPLDSPRTCARVRSPRVAMFTPLVSPLEDIGVKY